MKLTSTIIPLANIREIRVEPMDDKYDAELQSSMDRIGQHQPIKVIQFERKGWLWFLRPRIYLLLDGQRRVKAARRLGWTVICGEVIDSWTPGMPNYAGAMHELD